MYINKKISIALIILSACGSIKQTDNVKVAVRDSLTVSKIRELNSVYLIEATRNDSTFTIIFPKLEELNNKLKKGLTYKFELKKIYPKKDFISVMEVHYYQIGNHRIKLNQGNHWSIYADTTSLRTL